MDDFSSSSATNACADKKTSLRIQLKVSKRFHSPNVSDKEGLFREPPVTKRELCCNPLKICK